MKDLLKYYTVLQPMIKKAMGEWQHGDKGYCITHNESYLYDYETNSCCCNKENILIPLTIDPVNPKRGLWGMLEGAKVLKVYANGSVNLRVLVEGEFEKYYEADTPTEAILKALCHQWEVEVK